MNILETIVQLRDDLKSWVTNNLNALNAKIEANTVPIDSELNSTSTNPVQNKAISAKIDSLNSLVGDTSVSTQIAEAIASQNHFSGDYNDLINAPDIVEDESGEVVYADESGNIIFKIDADGAHTTDIEVDGTSLSDKIPVWDAKSDFSGNYNDLTDAPNIIENDTGDMIVSDEDGNIIFKIDASGLNTTTVQANEVKINGQDVIDMINNHTIVVDDTLSDTSINPVQNKVISAELASLNSLVGDTPVAVQISEAIESQEHFSGDYNDLTNAPNITEDNESNMVVADESGNIIFRVDGDGINTTAIKIANRDVLDIIDDYLDTAVIQREPPVQFVTWEADD